MSPEQRQRLRGLQVLHRRFWHAKLQDLKTLLERGGVDLDESEIKAVIAMAISTSTSVKPETDELPRAIGLLLGEITIEGMNG